MPATVDRDPSTNLQAARGLLPVPFEETLVGRPLDEELGQRPDQRVGPVGRAGAAAIEVGHEASSGNEPTWWSWSSSGRRMLCQRMVDRAFNCQLPPQAHPDLISAAAGARSVC
jgi:hypothetical protein